MHRKQILAESTEAALAQPVPLPLTVSPQALELLLNSRPALHEHRTPSSDTPLRHPAGAAALGLWQPQHQAEKWAG